MLSLEPLLTVLEALRSRPDIGLTFLSSGGTVYGNPARLPVQEDDPTEPMTAYGISKLACEKYITMYATLYGIRARVLRCSNVYGEGQRADRMQGAVAVFIDCMANHRPITIWGNGTIVRDYLYIDDVVAATLRLAAHHGGPTVVNVGSGDGHSLLQLIDVLSAVTGMPAKLQFAAGRDFDVREIVLDIARLRSEGPASGNIRRIGDPRDFQVGVGADSEGFIAQDLWAQGLRRFMISCNGCLAGGILGPGA